MHKGFLIQKKGGCIVRRISFLDFAFLYEILL